MMRIGLDVGSTTLKCIVLNDQNEIIYKDYERHYSQITEKAASMLRSIARHFPQEKQAQLCISGSAGMGFAESMGIPFVQEVYATRVSIKRLLPRTDVVIELGGEDAKILFVSGNMEVRMNGSCAGGTGAFIDQMATLLQLTPSEMNDLAAHQTKDLHHRLALRRVRQVRHPAAAQPGRAQGGRLPPPSSAPWSTRPSQVLRRGAKSRATSCISAAR